MGADLAISKQLYKYLVTFHLFPSILKAVLNMLGQLYRYLATFFLFPNNLRAFLNMVKQLYSLIQLFVSCNLYSASSRASSRSTFFLTNSIWRSSLKSWYRLQFSNFYFGFLKRIAEIFLSHPYCSWNSLILPFLNRRMFEVTVVPQELDSIAGLFSSNLQ